jgi:protein TonB
MKPKKNPELEVGRNSSLYFAIGLFLMLLVTYSMLNFKTYEKSVISMDVLDVEAVDDEVIPIIEFEVPPPPPPPAVVEQITIIEDVEEVEETLIESTEIAQEDAIEERVYVEDVEVEEIEEDIEVPFAVVEKVPVWPGCEKYSSNDDLKKCFQVKIAEHLTKNFRYPEVALELGIYGRVFVLFAIDNKGNVANIRTRGPDKTLEKEAHRIISLLPKMKPGQQRNKDVAVPYSLPINFQMLDN